MTRRHPRAAQDARLREIIEAARPDHVTAHDLILASIRTAIMAGILAPGTRLRQEELADAFGTSRIPVREALRGLEFEGLVTSEPHRGFTVTAMDERDVEEIYDLRILLETEAIRLAVPLLTDDDELELQSILHAIRTAKDPDPEVASRDRFYLRLYSVTGRPRLVGLIMRLRQDTARVIGWATSPHSSAVHEQVFDAVRDGDAERAVQLLTDHYRRASGLIRRSIREAPARSGQGRVRELGGRALAIPTRRDGGSL